MYTKSTWKIYSVGMSQLDAHDVKWKWHFQFGIYQKITKTSKFQCHFLENDRSYRRENFEWKFKKMNAICENVLFKQHFEFFLASKGQTWQICWPSNFRCRGINSGINLMYHLKNTKCTSACIQYKFIRRQIGNRISL